MYLFNIRMAILEGASKSSTAFFTVYGIGVTERGKDGTGMGLGVAEKAKDGKI